MSSPAVHPPRALAIARTLVTPALAAASAMLTPELRRVVEYHWGWVNERGEPIVARAGKLLRPALALLSAEAVGAPAERGLAAATALELTHDITLLHDDVMDGDRERRKRPTAWAVFGVGAAICAGDALVLLAQRVLLADASPARAEALAALGAATETVIAGQALDLAFERRCDVTVEEYVRMASMKTGALLSCAASLGALLAQAAAPSVASLAGYGRALGLSFQAVDDWLGIGGAPGRVGKPRASDLRQRKSSLPIVVGAAASGREGRELRELLQSTGTLSEAEIEQGVALLDATEAEAVTLSLARRELTRALACLEEAKIETGPREALVELAHFVVERQH
jgi:geranylgeranyl diphosphate synthase type I